jgi:hypothetical protein
VVFDGDERPSLAERLPRQSTKLFRTVSEEEVIYERLRCL